jgi:hypothetical protein
MHHSVPLMMHHINGATIHTPYISLTASLGVARTYAEVGRFGTATSANPGYVYLIDIPDSLPANVCLYDPVKEIANSVPNPPLSIPYQHEGTQDYLLGVVNPAVFKSHLQAYRFAGVSAGRAVVNIHSQAPSQQLLTIVRALRDAEVLALGMIPGNWVIHREPVF